MPNHNNNAAELDKLFDEVITYKSSRDYREILNFMSRFRNIAPFNLMLVRIQKPGSQYVATAEDWLAKFERRPKPGARPLAITINRNHDATTRLTTIYHELGHAYCGHLHNPEINYLPRRYSLPLQVREFEAESVCWMLCERQGIKNPSLDSIVNNHRGKKFHGSI